MRVASALGLGVGLLVAGCSSNPQAHVPSQPAGERPSPLGASYILAPLPSDDDSLLGRVIEQLPSGGRSLEEVSRANPCADRLAEPKVVPSLATFEDAEELAIGGRASLTLGTFGFSGDVSRATHFVYKLETEKRVSRVDTPEYEVCCKEKNSCGYGFVSALVYGDGEYATAEETAGSASATMIVATAEGRAALKVLHRRHVKGFVAALVRVADPAKSAGLARAGSLGDAAAYGVTVDESSLPQQVQSRYAAGAVKVTGGDDKWAFQVAGKELTENEFARNYRALTGSDDLNHVDRRRNTALAAVLGGLTAASGAVAIYGFTHLKRNCTLEDHEGSGVYYTPTVDCKSDNYQEYVGGGNPGGVPSNYDLSKETSNSTGALLAGFGTVGVIAFGAFFTYTLLSGDGHWSDHTLSLSDGKLYAQRYNRILLKKSVRDTQELMRRLEAARQPARDFSMHLSPLGAYGTF